MIKSDLMLSLLARIQRIEDTLTRVIEILQESGKIEIPEAEELMMKIA